MVRHLVLVARLTDDTLTFSLVISASRIPVVAIHMFPAHESDAIWSVGSHKDFLKFIKSVPGYFQNDQKIADKSSIPNFAVAFRHILNVAYMAPKLNVEHNAHSYYA